MDPQSIPTIMMDSPRRRAQHELNLYTPNTLYGDDAIDDDGGTFDTEGFLHPGSPSSSLSAQTARTRSWESLPHKSIKCSILERLRDDRQQDSLARRNESDLLGADPKAQVSLAHASSIISAALLRALTTSTGPGFHIIPELPGETPRGHASSAAHIFILYLHLKSFLFSSSTICIHRRVTSAIAPRKWHRGAKHHPALPHLAADKCESFCSSFHLIPKLKPQPTSASGLNPGSPDPLRVTCQATTYLCTLPLLQIKFN
ncbi:hypothetical protein C8R45DRAFT_993130 [Mycena sanguinolenta]|nr:hypothetical protein C8R45DRAFT_993130 [Mycena sanguinolenta]